MPASHVLVLHEGDWVVAELLRQYRHEGRWRAMVRYSTASGYTYVHARWCADLRPISDGRVETMGVMRRNGVGHSALTRLVSRSGTTKALSVVSDRLGPETAPHACLLWGLRWSWCPARPVSRLRSGGCPASR
jgi:hypothetical protein